MGNKDITRMIKELGNRLKLTQEQFAQKVGVTLMTMNNWEKGHRRPHPFLLKKLLNIVNKSGIKMLRRKI